MLSHLRVCMCVHASSVSEEGVPVAGVQGSEKYDSMRVCVCVCMRVHKFKYAYIHVHEGVSVYD